MRDRKPNLLFIYTDEQRADTLAAYGNDRIEMPNLNALAAESVVFRDAYVTQPVCTPSRSTLLTGQWPHTNGCVKNNVPLRPDTRTLGEMLKQAGYATAHHGKWHLGDEIIPQHGFDEFISVEDNYRAYYSKPEYLDRLSTYHHWAVARGHEPDSEKKGRRVFGRTAAARFPEADGKPAFLAENAIRFMTEHRDEPFALFINFLEPHMPFSGPRDDQYSPDDVPAPDNWNQEMGDDVPLRNRLQQFAYQTRGEGKDNTASEENIRRLRARYWGLCSLVDTHVGVILDALRGLGLMDDTVVVYTSDHGDMMGNHGIIAKTVMYQEALRVPFFVRSPELVGAARVVAQPVSQIDVVPTVLDLLGLPAEPQLQGKSLGPAMAGEATLDDNDVFIEWNGPDSTVPVVKPPFTKEDAKRVQGTPGRAVITPEGWKLVLYADDVCELYDLNTDPSEMRNLFADPSQRSRIAALTAKIRDWQKRVSDDAPLPAMD